MSTIKIFQKFRIKLILIYFAFKSIKYRKVAFIDLSACTFWMRLVVILMNVIFLILCIFYSCFIVERYTKNLVNQYFSKWLMYSITEVCMSKRAIPSTKHTNTFECNRVWNLTDMTLDWPLQVSFKKLPLSEKAWSDYMSVEAQFSSYTSPKQCIVTDWIQKQIW